MEIKYTVEINATGDILARCYTLEEAVRLVEDLVEADIKDGSYEPNYHAVRDLETGEIILTK